MPQTSTPFFIRGGYYNLTDRSGLFYFSSLEGSARADNGFRVVLGIANGI